MKEAINAVNTGFVCSNDYRGGLKKITFYKLKEDMEDYKEKWKKKLKWLLVVTDLNFDDSQHLETFVNDLLDQVRADQDKKWREEVRKINYIDCPCDANDCERCDALSDLLKTLLINK